MSDFEILIIVIYLEEEKRRRIRWKNRYRMTVKYLSGFDNL